jgi:hypothetical protein
VRDWDLANPLVASLSQRRLGVLLGWNFTRGWSLPGALVQPLAHWTEQKVAIGEARIDSGRLLLCGFAPDRSGGDWPVTPAFVPFLHQAMAHLFQVRQSAPVGGRAGSPLPLPAELGKWRAVDGPGSGRPAVDASASIVPTEPGIYEFLQGGDRRLYAVNLPAEESDPAVWPGGEPWKDLVAKVPPPPGKMPRAQLAAADAEQRAPLWWWAIAAAALLILLELVLSNRTAR